MRTIVHPEILSYDFMFQRPGQLMRSFSHHGHRTIFVNKNHDIAGAKKYSTMVEKEPNHFIAPEGTDLSQFAPYVMYYTFPPNIIYANEKDTDFLIFDSVDEPTGVFSFWNTNGEYYESLERADLVLASADTLYKKAKKYNKNVIKVPNACEYEYFSKDPNTRPHELANIPGPIVLYMGAIASWFDMELFFKAAFYYPDVSFVAIGASMDDTLMGFPDNVYDLGHQPYDRLPEFLHAADVLIIPFKQEQDVVKSCNPIKLYEYCCTQKPIITTAMPETKYDFVYWAKNEKQFLNFIPQAINESEESKKKKERDAFAKQNTWDARAKIILDKMEELL